MWITFLVIGAGIVSYALERVPMELTSVAIVTTLLLFFYAFPLHGADGTVLLNPRVLLAGFADPALFAILALLVIGQGLVRTGALDEVARHAITHGPASPKILFGMALSVVLVVSAILNNTPVVVIFIPILSALSYRLNRNVSRVMIPLSYAAILGGNLTLIGSSTNLLVSGTLESASGSGLNFFDFTVPGAMLAGVGFLYVSLVAPRLLTERASMASRIVGTGGKQFIVQLEVTGDSDLVGQKATAGFFPGLSGMTVRSIARGGQTFLPPFEDVALNVGDYAVVAATRSDLTDLLRRSPELFRGTVEEENGESNSGGTIGKGDLVLVETMIAPASRFIGQGVSQTGFSEEANCTILGVQRRSRMLRSSLDSIRLEAGDVLLVLGEETDIRELRSNSDVLLLEWSATDLPMSGRAHRALGIFALVVTLVATGMMPITIAAIAGATAMVAGGCLNIRQASRAVDRRVVTLVGAALAMGASLSATGGAAYLAHGLIDTLEGAPVELILSAFFLLIAMLTNVLSNNATAVLFTPIAISVAQSVNVDPMVFVVAVIFAANCSFATPMGYQTNLLVMGPGHYRFSDYLRVGIPLIIILWVTYSAFAPWYYGL